MALTTVANLSLTANIANALSVGGNGANLGLVFGTSMTDGTGASQANVAFWGYRTLAASTSEQLDLTGSLTSPLGTTISPFARIKVLLVSADPGNTNNVQVGGGSNAVSSLLGTSTDYVVVRPGATVCWICGNADSTGYVVTSGTAHFLQVANGGSGTSVGYTIAVIGANT
jgi:hypothetical protein